MIAWTDEMTPHLIAGGIHNEMVVQYWGVSDPERGFHYSIPGVVSLLPLWTKADSMKPLTAEQANAIEAEQAKAYDAMTVDELLDQWERSLGMQAIPNYSNLAR